MRETDRQTDRDRETETERDRDRDRDRKFTLVQMEIAHNYTRNILCNI